jgi:hypothetical protein
VAELGDGPGLVPEPVAAAVVAVAVGADALDGDLALEAFVPGEEDVTHTTLSEGGHQPIGADRFKGEGGGVVGSVCVHGNRDPSSPGLLAPVRQILDRRPHHTPGESGRIRGSQSPVFTLPDQTTPYHQ